MNHRFKNYLYEEIKDSKDLNRIEIVDNFVLQLKLFPLPKKVDRKSIRKRETNYPSQILLLNSGISIFTETGIQFSNINNFI